MALKSRQLIKEIKDGNEEVLLYLFRKEYAVLKRIFFSGGAHEKEIPALTAAVIVKVWMEIHKNDFSENIDLSSYLVNTAKENARQYATEKKLKRKMKAHMHIDEVDLQPKTPQEVMAECVNVLDDASRKALQWHFAENHSVEQVAQKLKIDTVAAHDFLHKAFAQLASIAKIRMDYTG